MDIVFAIRRLKQVIGQEDINTSDTYTSDGKDAVSFSYAEAPYTKAEGLCIVQGLITQALAEQSRRDRIIANIRTELESE